MTNKIKILFADDDKNICELGRLYLEKEGHTFEILKNGKKIKIDNFTEKLFKF